ncbi:unnamed protein product [Closterium sp. Naga37s-1]|nr:unnamed protein product [Closterium sp. Naga37s-1]
MPLHPIPLSHPHITSQQSRQQQGPAAHSPPHAFPLMPLLPYMFCSHASPPIHVLLSCLSSHTCFVPMPLSLPRHSDLANNNIGPLTDSIGTIPNLEYLYLGGNNFTGSTIPSTITALTNLVVLDDVNLLEIIPATIPCLLEILPSLPFPSSPPYLSHPPLPTFPILPSLPFPSSLPYLSHPPLPTSPILPSVPFPSSPPYLSHPPLPTFPIIPPYLSHPPLPTFPILPSVPFPSSPPYLSHPPLRNFPIIPSLPFPSSPPYLSHPPLRTFPILPSLPFPSSPPYLSHARGLEYTVLSIPLPSHGRSPLTATACSNNDSSVACPASRSHQWHPMCGGAERQQPLLHRLWFEMPRTPSHPPLLPLSGPLPCPLSPACSDYDITVACPAKNTSCVVEQRDGSEFCTACAAFCSSCIQPAPGGYHLLHPACPCSGLSTGAIVGIVVGVLLFTVGTIAVVFIVIQCGKRSKEVEVEYTTQATGAYAGDNQYKPPQGAYAGYQPDGGNDADDQQHHAHHNAHDGSCGRPRAGGWLIGAGIVGFVGAGVVGVVAGVVGVVVVGAGVVGVGVVGAGVVGAGAGVVGIVGVGIGVVGAGVVGVVVVGAGVVGVGVVGAGVVGAGAGVVGIVGVGIGVVGAGVVGAGVVGVVGVGVGVGGVVVGWRGLNRRRRKRKRGRRRHRGRCRDGRRDWTP